MRRRVVRESGAMTHVHGRKEAPRTVADHRHMHERHWTRDEALAFLENPDRRRTQNPERLWKSVGLASGQCLADIGAGSGYYAFPAARIVGARGRVWAIDVSPDLVALLTERATEHRTANLIPVRSTPRRIPLPDGIADFVLFANILHGIPPTTISESVRLLSPTGQLINVDWKKESPEGPPVEVRLAENEVSAVLAEYGLKRIRRWDPGPYQYAASFARGKGPGRRNATARTSGRAARSPSPR